MERSCGTHVAGHTILHMDLRRHISNLSGHEGKQRQLVNAVAKQHTVIQASHVICTPS